MATKRFITPFAESGIKAPVSDVPAGTDVNYETGYTPEYALDPVSDPSARFVEITNENQLLNDITGNVKLWQDDNYPEFITTAKNGGVAHSYNKNVVVRYNGELYISTEDGNDTLPTSAKWIPYLPSEIAKYLELKIFQSPTDGLTEINTRTLLSGEVYEVRKVSDGSLATIYSDAAGTTEIVQNGTNNVSGSDGVVEFFVEDGGYYVDVNSVKSNFNVGDAWDLSSTYTFNSVDDFKSSSIHFPDGKTIHLNDRGADFTKISGLVTANDIDIISSSQVLQNIELIEEADGVYASHLGCNSYTDGVDYAPNINRGLQVYRNVIVDSRLQVGIRTPITHFSNGATLRGSLTGSPRGNTSGLYHFADATGYCIDIADVDNAGCAVTNMKITGGNTVGAIRCKKPYFLFSHLYMEIYDGNGIRLEGDVASAGSVASGSIENCRWVPPEAPVNYTGYHVALNGGDVTLYRCTGIRGARGVDIVTGQTIRVVACSLNKQSTYNGYSSLPDSETAAIRLSGTLYKEAITIDGCYLEACTNTIYSESCESLTISNNKMADNGVAGVIGTRYRYNNIVNIVDSNSKAVTLSNNYINMSGNGRYDGVGDPDNQGLFAVRIGAGIENIIFQNNLILADGTYSRCMQLESEITYLGGEELNTASQQPADTRDNFLRDIRRNDAAVGKFTGNGAVGQITITDSRGVESIEKLSTGVYLITTEKNYTDTVGLSVSAENAAVQAAILSTLKKSSANTFTLSCFSDFSTPVDGRGINFCIVE